MNKYALVTGASRGIGRCASITLAKQGYNVIINYQGNHAAAEETKALILAESDVDVALLPFNVGNAEAVKTAIDNWYAEHPDTIIEVLVNNAGIRQDALMAFMSDEQWKDVLDVSLHGMYYVTKAIMSKLVMHRYGRIINIVSLSGLKGMPGQVNYSAAKSGVIGATKALAQELAKRNITVNAIAPGFIQTDMTSDLDEAEMKKMIPMNRFGKPEEVAALVGFLASKDAAYITGQVISINGGLYS